MYPILKSLHIIFIVTWFAALFYIVRLFIYNTEANEKPELEKNILQKQFKVMIKRLWYIIAWPSAILTFLFGLALLMLIGYNGWMFSKFILILILLIYHMSLHKICSQQQNNIFKFSSLKLRIWNEVATVLLFIIVFIAVLKDNFNTKYALCFTIVMCLILVSGIIFYKKIRKGKN